MRDYERAVRAINAVVRSRERVPLAVIVDEIEDILTEITECPECSAPSRLEHNYCWNCGTNLVLGTRCSKD